MPLNQQLTDLGGVPVLWDSDLGTLVQDPTQGGTNRYGPGDLFRDPSNGDVYQLGQDGSLSLYRIGAPPTVPVPGALDGTSTFTNVSSAGKSWTSSPTSTTPAISTTGNLQQWIDQATRWLGKASFIQVLPNGVLVAAGALAYTYMRKRRRNPRPILRNPGGGARIVYNRLLGGWYVVMGPDQTPISGRFGSKEQARAWMQLRRRDLGRGRQTNRYGYYSTSSNPGKAARARRRRERSEERYLYYSAWAPGTRLSRWKARTMGDERYARMLASYQRSKRNPGRRRRAARAADARARRETYRIAGLEMRRFRGTPIDARERHARRRWWKGLRGMQGTAY